VDVSFSQMLFNRGSQLRHTETGNSLHRILYIVCEISVLAIQRELWRIDSGEIALRREPEYAIGSGPAIFPSLYVGDSLILKSSPWLPDRPVRPTTFLSETDRVRPRELKQNTGTDADRKCRLNRLRSSDRYENERDRAGK